MNPHTRPAAQAAIQLGHTVTWEYTTTCGRWICRTCGAAAYRYHRTLYGTATRRACPSR